MILTLCIHIQVQRTIEISLALPSIKTTHKLDKKKGLQDESHYGGNKTPGY